MSEVKRYFTQLWRLDAINQRFAHGGLGAVEIVRSSDFDRIVSERDAALAREAALREELDMIRKAVPNSTRELVSLQQRLTAAEKLLGEALCHAQRMEPISASLFNRIDAALKPTEGEGL